MNLVGDLCARIASAVSNVRSGCLARKPRPRLSMLFLKNLHYLCLRVATALFKSKKDFTNKFNKFYGVLLKTMTSPLYTKENFYSLQKQIVSMELWMSLGALQSSMGK